MVDEKRSAVAQISMAPRLAGEREQLLGPRSDMEAQMKINHQSPSAYNSGREAIYSVCSSWASRKFMSGVVILFPIAVTCYIAWWFLTFFDGFFSPLYQAMFGFHVFGLGFVTSMAFIFLVGIFVHSWIGASVLWLGEWLIKRVPLVKHIYSASKQISSAISPDQNTQAFKEVAIIRHPRVGEYAFGFITSSLTLQSDAGEEELCTVYIPTNHLYIGDIFLVPTQDILRPNLSVREGIEIVVSGGMSMPSTVTLSDRRVSPMERTRGIRAPEGAEFSVLVCRDKGPLTADVHGADAVLPCSNEGHDSSTHFDIVDTITPCDA